MAVLTWQNVDGPRQGYGAPSIDSAIRAMNSGFSALQGVDKSFTDAANANFDNQKEQNTGALINSLANINSIADLDKHSENGAFSADNLKAQFGGAVDYEKFNTALMARRGQIQTDADNQLKLNEATDYQAHQGDLSRLAGLANTDPAAYNAALKNLDLGAAAGKILEQTNPWMNDTRQDSTTQRGQSLSYAGTMAGVAVDRDRLNMQKADMQRRNALDDKDRAKKETDGAFNAGSQYAYDHAGEGSDNDVTKGFTETDAYRQLNPLQKEAALKGLHQGASEATRLTDEQQEQYDAAVRPVDTLASAIDSKVANIRANNAQLNPNYLYTQGAESMEGMSQADSVNEMFKDTKYNDRGEIADQVSRMSTKYRVSPALIASIAKNAIGSSGIRLGGLVRGDTTYDWGKMEEAVAAASEYQKTDQATKDKQAMSVITAPVDSFKKEAAKLQAQYKRAKATHQDTADLERRMQALNAKGALVYNQVAEQGSKVEAAATSNIPQNPSNWYYNGMASTSRR